MIHYAAVARSGQRREERQTAANFGSLNESEAERGGGSKRADDDGAACPADGATMSGKSPQSSMTPHKRSLAARTLPADHEVCSIVRSSFVPDA